MSKHQEVITFIKNLEEGEKISVRGLADKLKVSEGTAYKAIKEAEKLSIVTTIERVGTIKVGNIDKKNLINLTCNDIVNIVTGSVLGGKSGLYKSINNFVIGAMTLDEIEKYLGPNDLLISGNRDATHKLALENNCAVLITGGFKCSDYVKKLADEKKLPIISSQYDTFTTSTLINKAISQKQIKSDIVLAEDIMKTDFTLLKFDSTVADLKEAYKTTNDENFYIIDAKEKLIGVISYLEDNYRNENDEVAMYMNKKITCVNSRTSVSYAGHILLKGDITRIPVLEGKRMVGVLHKSDIEKTLRNLGYKPSKSQTIEDLIIRNFEKEKIDKGVIYKGKILPEMLTILGIASWSVLNFIMSITGISALKSKNIYNIIVDSFNVIFIKPLQIEAMIKSKAEIIDMGKNTAKVEITLTSGKDVIGKAYLVTKMFGK